MKQESSLQSSRLWAIYNQSNKLGQRQYDLKVIKRYIEDESRVCKRQSSHDARTWPLQNGKRWYSWKIGERKENELKNDASFEGWKWQWGRKSFKETNAGIWEAVERVKDQFWDWDQQFEQQAHFERPLNLRARKRPLVCQSRNQIRRTMTTCMNRGEKHWVDEYAETIERDRELALRRNRQFEIKSVRLARAKV